MAATVLNPYLHFNGNAEEVLNFYKNIFGGEMEISRFSSMPEMPVADAQKELVVHGLLKTDSLQLMVSDAMQTDGVKHGENISLSLSGDDAAELTKYFEGLCEGGKITEPLATAPWGDSFGMVTDKFGINWMVNIAAPKS